LCLVRPPDRLEGLGLRVAGPRLCFAGRRAHVAGPGLRLAGLTLCLAGLTPIMDDSEVDHISTSYVERQASRCA